MRQLLRQRPMLSKSEWSMAAAIVVIGAFTIVVSRESVPHVPALQTETQAAAAPTPSQTPAIAANPTPVPAAIVPAALPVTAAETATTESKALPVVTAKPVASVPTTGSGDRTTLALPVVPAPEVAIAAAASLPVLPEPPRMVSDTPHTAEPESLLASAAEVAPPDVPHVSDPLVSVSIASVTEPRRGGLFHKLGFAADGKPSEFVPPKPVREAATELSADLRRRMKRPVPMDVKVYIDREGKVEYAELLSKGTGVNRDLASVAVFASRHWLFSPARLGDQTVPSEVVLRFKFGPEAR
jgi:hypothetical protein